MERVLIGLQGGLPSAAGLFSSHLRIVKRNSSSSKCYYTRPRPLPSPIRLTASLNPPPPLRYSSLSRGDLCNDTTRELKDKGHASGRGLRSVCHAGPFLSYPTNLSWISAIASLALMLTKGTAINKSFIVPLFALLAPPSIISWIKGEYGIWTAFLALLLRLFFFIPGELELPLMALLLIIVSPYQVMDLRGIQAGAIIALTLAGYLAFQHFSRIGNLKQAFEQGSLVATLAIVCLTVVSIMLLI